MVKTNLNEEGYFVFISLRNHLNVRFVKHKKIYDEAKTFLKLNSQRTSFSLSENSFLHFFRLQSSDPVT